jgi:hypothetical protein
MNVSFLIAFICFLIGALAGIFEWNLGEFDAIAWGLAFLALGHLWIWHINVGNRT